MAASALFTDVILLAKLVLLLTLFVLLCYILLASVPDQHSLRVVLNSPAVMYEPGALPRFRLIRR
jgi:hypothetical protein